MFDLWILYRLARQLVLVLAVCGASLAVPSSEARAETKRPNILLIMTDDMGWMDLSCQGNTRLETPRIDALARLGVRFTNAYAAAPVCSPTRAALITGLAPARLHITQHGKDGPSFWPKERVIQPPAARHVLPLESITMAERLQEIGYATGFFGKWHLSGSHRDPQHPTEGPAFWPQHQGFDVNVGGCGLGGPPTYFDPYRIPAIESRKPGEYLTDRLADETISFLRDHHSVPWFVCLWTYNPHYPFEAPEELVAKYKDRVGPGLKVPTYGGQIEATDRAVGRVLDALDQLELESNTLVIFTSDNGGWEGATDNRPLRSGKGDLYEGGIRVPLIVRWPGVTDGNAGKQNAAPVISMDLTATILDAAGVDAADVDADVTPVPLDGYSLKNLLSGKEPQKRALYFHYPHFAWHRSNRPGGAVRDGRFKLIKRYDNGDLELFDLEADPSERNDLVAAKPDLARKLEKQLEAWLAETNAELPTAVAE